MLLSMNGNQYIIHNRPMRESEGVELIFFFDRYSFKMMTSRYEVDRAACAVLVLRTSTNLWVYNTALKWGQASPASKFDD